MQLHWRVLCVTLLLLCGGLGLRRGRPAPARRAIKGVCRCNIFLGHRQREREVWSPDGDQFEYIVVGAGAAGGAGAARLARAGRRVLLLEAGGPPPRLAAIPSTVMAWTGSELDWFYDTVPNNKSCLGSRGRRCRLSRGRCLGGSTTINYMLYTRGSPRDYDYHLPGWSWPELKPYFLRSEGLQAHLPTSSAPHHNTSGPVKINFFDDSQNPWRRRIVDGLMDLNFPFNIDVNADSQIGVTQSLGYVSGGERVSAATAYLRDDVKGRLKIAPNSLCTGIIIDENDVARGVTVMRGKLNRTIRLYATREVILSAGAVGSAQLLMLSGIGPAEHLQQLKIPVRVDLPVGENMSDHVMPIMFVKVDQTPEKYPNLTKLGVIGVEAVQWLTTRTGPLASIGVTDVMGFANTNCYNFEKRQLENAGPDCTLPTLQLIFAYLDRYLACVAPFSFMRIFSKEVSDQILAANADSALLVVAPILLQPRSRGRIRLASADPLTPPVITPNYLDDEGDVQEMVKSVAIVEQLVEARTFRGHGASLLRLRLRGCPGAGEAGYWACYVRHVTATAQHAAGTAALGAVVDARLRVRGVRALRAADLGVLPRPPRGNTAAAALALGERLADFVLEHRGDAPE